jgi:hypothetical protein
MYQPQEQALALRQDCAVRDRALAVLGAVDTDDGGVPDGGQDAASSWSFFTTGRATVTGQCVCTTELRREPK